MAKPCSLEFAHVTMLASVSQNYGEAEAVQELVHA